MGGTYEVDIARLLTAIAEGRIAIAIAEGRIIAIAIAFGSESAVLWYDEITEKSRGRDDCRLSLGFSEGVVLRLGSF
eukprot:COSAG02_NODE_349_length_24073_cov_102.816092_18_plen_77_part_00